jgi:hypothetical protein
VPGLTIDLKIAAVEGREQTLRPPVESSRRASMHV